ncbi:Platelet-derived growth factor receptor alpha [Orchesella cincta]|uniref:Platelet-derived growth factor receptor alpha n=1 Tax=Orchesella cincta TaxID=48709 RepID=A0A1D2MGU3_ORCCI|nr:Platelet-derived growth factor receptor alpha [Orchesella cincta]
MKSEAGLEGTRVGTYIVVDSSRNRSKSCWRSSLMCWVVFIVTTSSWLSQFRQVSCLFQQASMEARDCSNFRHDEYPLITVRHGEDMMNKSFSIREEAVLDHEMFFFKCVAPYPIEWISNEPSINTLNHAASGSTKAVATHLHIYRSVSNISDRSTYRFIISTRVRYKKDQGFKDINGTCRSIVKPHCLTTSIVSLNLEGSIAMKIFDRFQQNQQMSSPPDSAREVDAVGNDSESRFHSEDDCDYRFFYEEDITDSRLTFTCEQDDGTPSSIGFIHQCSNAMTCLNLYRNSRLPSGCAEPAVGNFTCIGCEGKQLRLSQGVIGCESSTGEEIHGKSRKLLFFFTSLPNQHFPTKLYFRMEDAEPSEMMWLSELPSEVSLGEQITVTCNVSSFYFAGGTRLALKFADSNKLTFIKALLKSSDGNQYASTAGGVVIEATIPIASTSLEKVYCLAPVWNSFEWVNKSRELRVKDLFVSSTVAEVISEDIIIAVSVTIFLTALLVAMMFGILWIRIGKKTGRLNVLTASEIEEFRRSSVSEENKSIKLQNSNDMVYDTAYEIKRDRLLIDETAVLGHGHFGVVLKGVVKDSRSEVRINVAVKTLKTKVDVGSLKALLSELKILASIGKHSNVVNLVGACTKKMGKGKYDMAIYFLNECVECIYENIESTALHHCFPFLPSSFDQSIFNLIGFNRILNYLLVFPLHIFILIFTGEVYVCVEYCANGNLQNFLRQHRQTFRNQLENDVLVIETPIRKLSSSSENIMTIDLIKWAWETAKGMEFLGSKKVIHGDLATRNILLTADHVAKVSDFGLSRQLVDYYYVQKETGPMPWKWMALESLRDMKFSVQSDVWSFGVAIWELFTLGIVNIEIMCSESMKISSIKTIFILLNILAEIPYSGCSWSAEFVETLASGHRLGKPKYATSEMYDLMRECWKGDFSSRPSFFAIRMFFEDILTQCTNQDYMQFSVSTNGTATTEDAYCEIMQSQPLLHSPRIIIEEEGEDDVFE